MRGKRPTARLGHRVYCEEVGPRIFDLHCLDCGWQGFTVYGQNAAEMMADRHDSAARRGDPMSHLSDMELRQDLAGYGRMPRLELPRVR